MKNKILTLSGKSGAGKTTLSDALVETGKYEEAVSFTTRTPRPGEIGGKHYNFISQKDFQEKLKNKEILEHTNINGNYYGTDLTEIKRIQSLNKTPVIVCDPECPKELSQKQKDGKFKLVSMFVKVSPELIAERIIDRMRDEFSKVELAKEGDVEEGIKQENKVKNTYEKRIQGMSDLSLNEISEIFDSLEENGEKSKTLLSTGIQSPFSKEAKWEKEINYDLVISPEGFGNNLNKMVKKVESKINNKKNSLEIK